MEEEKPAEDDTAFTDGQEIADHLWDGEQEPKADSSEQAGPDSPKPQQSIPSADPTKSLQLKTDMQSACREVKKLEELLLYRTPSEIPELTSRQFHAMARVLNFLVNEVSDIGSTVDTKDRERTMELVRMNLKMDDLKKTDRKLQGKIFEVSETQSDLAGPSGRLTALEQSLREKQKEIDSLATSNLHFQHSLEDVHRQLQRSNEQAQRWKDLSDTVVDLEGRLLNEKHRLNTATSHALEASASVQGLQRKISASSTAQPTPRVEPVASDVVTTIQDMKHQLASLSKEVRRLNVQDQLHGYAKLENFVQVNDRLDVAEEQLKKFRATEDAMYERMATFHKKEIQLRRVDRELRTLSTHVEEFEHTVSNRLAAFWTQEERKAVQRFMQKWGNDQQKANLKPFLAGWWSVVTQNKEVRVKARLVKQKTDESFIHSRLKAWGILSAWKRSRREQAALFEAIANVGESVASVKATVQHNRDLAGEMHDSIKDPIFDLTRKLETLTQSKAEHAVVVDMYRRLEGRLDNDEAFKKIYHTHEEIWTAVRKLESSKASAEKMDGQHRKAVKLALDTQGMLKKIRSDLESRATFDSIAQKADAETVEEVLVLLARHADQMACIVASDLERMRTTMVRFLEQSPDIRTASMSLELSKPLTQLATQPVAATSKSAMGATGMLYRIAPDVEDRIRALAANNLAIPTHLASAVARQAQTRREELGKSLEKTMLPSMRQPLSAKKTAPKADTTQMDLRALLERAPGWLSGSHVAPSEVASPASPRSVSSQQGVLATTASSVPKAPNLRRYTSPRRGSDASMQGKSARFDLRDCFPASAEAAITGADRPNTPSSHRVSIGSNEDDDYDDVSNAIARPPSPRRHGSGRSSAGDPEGQEAQAGRAQSSVGVRATGLEVDRRSSSPPSVKFADG
mmetsp:Transcript_69826/g.167631  ORF Transcript_69826/g.167631 Transcript_69826/m.167631 type:complete len:916 (-) Transcript_69826:99-2846(-)